LTLSHDFYEQIEENNEVTIYVMDDEEKPQDNIEMEAIIEDGDDIKTTKGVSLLQKRPKDGNDARRCTPHHVIHREK
jgi:hypothetical protein